MRTWAFVVPLLVEIGGEAGRDAAEQDARVPGRGVARQEQAPERQAACRGDRAREVRLRLGQEHGVTVPAAAAPE